MSQTVPRREKHGPYSARNEERIVLFRATMKVVVGALTILMLGCSSKDADGIGTGVSCDDVNSRVCCQTDVYDKPTCVDGEWRCPAGFPNFIPSAQCTYPVYDDTGTKTACDVASDACETISCPTGSSLECPSGCTRYTIARYDETRGCLVPTERALCVPPDPHEKCLGLPSCRRNAMGELFRVPSICVMSEYEFCAGAEDTKVLSASVCDAG